VAPGTSVPGATVPLPLVSGLAAFGIGHDAGLSRCGEGGHRRASLVSSDKSAEADLARRIGQFLTGTEARELAAHLADGDTLTAAPTTTEVAEHLRPVGVLRTKPLDGRAVRNHAKFLAIDHRFMLVTSANFSWSAENGNVEFGVLIDNRNLAEAAEDGMRRAEDLLFELA